jgi:predicted nucleotidyltransferase
MADRTTQEALMNVGRRYAEVLRRELTLRSLYIFGSYATGKYGDDSDIDIAVVSDDLTGDMIEDTFALMRLRREIDTRIEPHPFPTSDFTEDNPIAREIMETGIRVL